MGTHISLIWIAFILGSIHSQNVFNQPISIVPNSNTLLNCTLNSKYNLNFSGKSLLPGSYIYKFNNISVLPPGLSLSSEGKLFGICQKQGNFSFQISMNANNNSNLMTNSTYRFSIIGNSNQIILPPAYVGIPYTAKVSLNTQQSNGIWSAKNMPTWLSFNSSSQTIYGIPQLQGSSIFYIGYNFNGGYTQTSLSIKVSSNILTIVPRTIQLYQNKPKNISFSAQNGVQPYNFLFINLPNYLITDKNILMYNGSCQIGNRMASSIILDSKGTANLFNISIICRQSLNQNIQISNFNMALSPSSNLRAQSLNTQFPPNNNISYNLSPFLNYPQTINQVGQGYVQTSNVALPKQVTQNQIIMSNSLINPQFSSPSFRQVQPTILPINNPSPTSSQKVIINDNQPLRGLVTGGTCIPDIMLPQPYSGSGTISSINYNNSTITLVSGGTLKLQPCTQMMYSGSSIKFDTGNNILFTAQRNTSIKATSPNPDILLSITNLN